MKETRKRRKYKTEYGTPNFKYRITPHSLKRLTAHKWAERIILKKSMIKLSTYIKKHNL